MRRGISIVEDRPGKGSVVVRQQFYRLRVRMWLNMGDPVRWGTPWGTYPAHLTDEGHTLETNVRWDREFLINGLFYGCEDMRAGGLRRLRIAPHLAYGDHGVPGVIPPQALLIAEVELIDHLEDGP